MCKYCLTHVEGHTEGDIFYLYIIRKVVFCASAHVHYIKFHAEITEILQVKDCSFYIHVGQFSPWVSHKLCADLKFATTLMITRQLT